MVCRGLYIKWVEGNQATSFISHSGKKDKVKLEERKRNSQNLPVSERAERNRPKQGTFGVEEQQARRDDTKGGDDDDVKRRKDENGDNQRGVLALFPNVFGLFLVLIFFSFFDECGKVTKSTGKLREGVLPPAKIFLHLGSLFGI